MSRDAAEGNGDGVVFAKGSGASTIRDRRRALGKRGVALGGLVSTGQQSTGAESNALGVTHPTPDRRDRAEDGMSDELTGCADDHSELGKAVEQLMASQGPGGTKWCNACRMNPANGCRHPLGPSLCPYRLLPPVQSDGED